MTATERLRELLDERGVEWDYGITGATTTSFNANGVDLTFTPMRDGLVCSTILTPEQAIAATLGDVPCLPHFWTHDGALHVELPKLPESISVRLPDQRDREVGSARVWLYTRDRGTCKLINAADDLGKGTSSCMCFECGYTALDDWWDEFKYCPNCGRRIEVDA